MCALGGIPGLVVCQITDRYAVGSLLLLFFLGFKHYRYEEAINQPMLFVS
jgi:hypothetical protein